MTRSTLIVAGFTLALQADGQTIYVNGSCGSDGWTGTSAVCAAPNGPKHSIQAAIPTDFLNLRIVVESGVYAGPIQYTPPFSPNPPTRNLTIESSAGAVIDCGGSGTALHFGGFDRGFIILRGFTLQNAGAGLSSHYRARVEMYDCVVRDCGTGIVNGGALSAWDTILEENSSPIVQPAMLERVGGTLLNRCIVRNNGSGMDIGMRTGGAGVYDSLIFGNATGSSGFFAVAGSGVFLRNTTIAGSTGPAVSAVPISGFATQVYAHNCILWGNNGGGQQIVLNGGTGFLDVSIRHSTVQDGFSGDGNLSSDPLFANASAGDYHLAPGSPAIDSGNAFLVPTPVIADLEGQPRMADDPAATNSGAPFPTYLDRGPYESGGTPYCPGDVDDDHDNDLNDLTGLLSQFGTMGTGLAGDLNRNGSVDLSDLTLLLSLFGLPCP